MLTLKTFRKGGVHPPENKTTAHLPIERIPRSAEYAVALSQHIGVPAQCCVKVGEKVAKYQLVGSAQGFVSANVHAPVSGTVKKIEKRKNAFGLEAETIVIVPEGDDVAPLHARTDAEIAALTAEELVEIIGDAGIVGLGGATFPTKVKLLPPKQNPVDTLVVNGAECEPYLTCDQLLMENHAAGIVEGIGFLMRSLRVERAVVGIEANKPEAIKAMRKAAEPDRRIEIQPLKVKYPQGGEKQLIDALLNRQIPSGGLPSAVGVVVQNVATAYSVWNAVRNGVPLVERIVTVAGAHVARPGNYLVPIGTPLCDIIAFAGGLPDDAEKVILGGPMMGKAASNLSAPSTKGVSGILAISRQHALRELAENCVRCASCVAACPMGLEPYLLARLSELKDYERLEKERVVDCIECGSCAYACISRRPLLDYIRLGKSRTLAIVKSRKTDR